MRLHVASLVFLLIILRTRPIFCSCSKHRNLESRQLWDISCDVTNGNQSLDQLLREITADYEIAPEIGILWIYQKESGNVTFTEHTLRNFTQLKVLSVVYASIGTGWLSIPSSVLQDFPRLRSLLIRRFMLSNETMETLYSMKDRINHLTILESKAPELLHTISKFTNLSTFALHGGDDNEICDSATFPRSIFQKSASTLSVIVVRNCPTQKTTSELFRGLRGLTHLRWVTSNVTEIESGAFDDLVNLEEISFMENRITTLPDGLFKNNRKLKYVGFLDQNIDNLSKINFTHLDDPGGFKLAMGTDIYYPFREDNL